MPLHLAAGTLLDLPVDERQSPHHWWHCGPACSHARCGARASSLTSAANASSRIAISDEARSELLYYFAGLGLSAYPLKNALTRIKELAAPKKTRVFVGATFQESQLQELNRLYYTLTGKVILSPFQTVEALTLCGTTLDRAKVTAILDRHRIKYQPGELDRALTIAAQKDFSGYFRFAVSLVQGTTSFREWFDMDESGNSRFNRDETNALEGLADLTGEKYETLLETILLTAPRPYLSL